MRNHKSGLSIIRMTLVLAPLAIVLFALGLMVTLNGAAISSDMPQIGLNSAVERPAAFKKSSNALNPLTATTVLAPDYKCDSIDYSGGAAAYYWKLTDKFGDSVMGMRFTPSVGYNCTLLTAHVGVYGGAIFGNPGMQVTVYADDGFGFPGTALGYVNVPAASLPHSGAYYYPVDLSSFGFVFSDGAEFHIGVSKIGGLGDTLAILSDNGSNGLLRSWEYYGAYGLMNTDWGIDVNFLIGVDICCGLAFLRGISFQQVDFMFDSAQVPNSDWGRLEVDCGILLGDLGLPRAYLNAYCDSGWFIQNLIIDTAHGDFTGTYFDLFVTPGVNVETLSTHIEVTPTPLSTFTDGVRTEYLLSPIAYNAENAMSTPGRGYATAIGEPPRPFNLNPVGPDSETVMKNAPGENVQCATNQCVPMSVANSLQFLEDKYGINVPQAHAQGLRGDNTLVGKLDDYMNRNVPVPGDRTKGGGVHPKNMLSGKFAYLAANGLANKLVHKHQGTGLTLGPGDPDGDSIPAADYTASGITSKFDGARPTWEWIYEQIRSGEDVEISINWANAAGNWAGAHNVRVFGAGITKGKKWIKYKHDREQTDIDPADNKGLEEVEVEVGDIDGDGLLNFGGKKHEISFALSESPARKPTPGTNRHSKDGYFPDQNPTGHTFHELYPVYCRNWVVDQWWDNGDGILSYCDTIRFRNQGNQSTSLEHIEDITTTITVTRLQDTAYYDYVYGNPRMVSIVPRAGDLWHEVWPQYCRMYELLEWLDNGTEVLDSCDYLVFKSLSPPDSGTIDTVHVEGSATDLITSVLSCCDLPGDASNNGVVNIQDITFLITFLYKGGPPPICYDEGDANGSRNINIQDITYLINYLYKGGPAPNCPSPS